MNKLLDKIDIKSKPFIQKLFASFNIQLNKGGDLSLWDYRDSRLELGVFSSNVPTFILNQDQRFMDWNIGFELIFGAYIGKKKTYQIQEWYKLIENFKKLPDRTEAFFGEGLLPITDRQRIVFKSPKYGRCVFTKILHPLIDRRSAKILGWSVVLNINSINKRSQFFTDLDIELKKYVAHLKYCTSFDAVIQSHTDVKQLLSAHLSSTSHYPINILELNAHSGELGLKLAASGHNVTIQEENIEFLRTIRSKQIHHFKEPTLVHRPTADLDDLSSENYNHVYMTHGMHHDGRHTEAMIKNIYRSLVNGGTFSVSGIYFSKNESKESLIDYFKSDLKKQGKFDIIKYQFDGTVEHYLDSFSEAITPQKIILLAKKYGFSVTKKEIFGKFYYLKFNK